MAVWAYHTFRVLVRSASGKSKKAFSEITKGVYDDDSPPTKERKPHDARKPRENKRGPATNTNHPARE